MQEEVESIKQQVKSRGFRAAIKLRNASNDVLAGSRSGQIYRVPNTRASYQASAPGEAPAVRSGHFRQSWRERVYSEESGKTLMVHSVIESKEQVGKKKKYLLGEILEDGKGRIAPRPYKEKIRKKADPDIRSIYGEKY